MNVTTGAVFFAITPVAKPRMTQRDKWAERPCVMRYRAFADELRALARKNGYELTDELFITFHIAMPESWSKKKKAEMNGKPHQAKPDLDNLVKAFQDALSKADQSIYFVAMRKYWAHENLIIVNVEMTAKELPF